MSRDLNDLKLSLPAKRKTKPSSKSQLALSDIPIRIVREKATPPQVKSATVIQAEEMQTSLGSEFPSFVKLLVQSHISSCFWMGLPMPFCKFHLPNKDIVLILEDENGERAELKYIAEKTGHSAGWRKFTVGHKLLEGDVLLFHLVEPLKFKFYKTLTASDTSTHGGFSVPHKTAEECFPPLDYKQQRPSQELVAKDLHGLEWRFRHIYRGQPRRHLLTTGWSAFVNKKKLVCGDAVLFLRGGDGELRLGIRRAAQVKSGAKVAVAYNQQTNDIASVVNAVSMKSVFNLCYNPRSSSSDFVIPFSKFSKSLANSFSPGMRFKMRIETEDATERRCTGLIVGIGDVDPLRWPGSKWWCLMVRWDDMEVTRHNRVSPWEIELSSSISGASGLVSPCMKRSRIGFTTQPDFPVTRDGTGMSDFRESSRFQKVLQGQEILGFHASFDGVDARKNHPPDPRGCFPGSMSWDSAIGNGLRSVNGSSEISYDGVDFIESLRLNKVLQGQETFSKRPYGGSPNVNQMPEHGDPRFMEVARAVNGGTEWSSVMQGYSTCVRPSAPLVRKSSMSSVQMFHQPSIPDPKFGAVSSVHNLEKLEINNHGSFGNSGTFQGNLTSSSPCGRNRFGTESQQDLAFSGLPNTHKQLGSFNLPLETQSSNKGSSNLVSACKSSCRLFGFLLTEESPAISKECNPSRIQSPYVHKTPHLSRGDEHFNSKPSSMTKILGGSCTKASDMYTVRDMLLDIAM